MLKFFFLIFRTITFYIAFADVNLNQSFLKINQQTIRRIVVLKSFSVSWFSHSLKRCIKKSEQWPNVQFECLLWSVWRVSSKISKHISNSQIRDSLLNKDIFPTILSLNRNYEYLGIKFATVSLITCSTLIFARHLFLFVF